MRIFYATKKIEIDKQDGPNTSMSIMLRDNLGCLLKDRHNEWYYIKDKVKIALFPFQVRMILELQGIRYNGL